MLPLISGKERCRPVTHTACDGIFPCRDIVRATNACDGRRHLHTRSRALRVRGCSREKVISDIIFLLLCACMAEVFMWRHVEALHSPVCLPKRSTQRFLDRVF